MKIFRRCCLVVLMLGAANALSADAAEYPDAVSAEQSAMIIGKMQSARSDLHYESVVQSPIAGVYQVQVKGGPILYVMADGEYFFDGDLYQVKPGRFVNLREQAMSGVRKELLATVAIGEMIVFSPASELKGVINVFTDVDCGYCRKLHREVPELNRRGIEVRYLAFPRAGIGSPSYQKVVSAWCSATPNAALTELKNGSTIEPRDCDDNPVAAQYRLGEQMGVTGTPAIILADGTMLPGYRRAADLAKILGIN